MSSLGSVVPARGRLAGKVAVITGGATGIGEAISRRFAAEGASVVVNGLPDDPVSDVVLRLTDEGRTATAHLGDVSQAEGARSLIERAVSQHGRIDVVVNNAGVFLFAGETQDYPEDLFDEHLRMNVRSAFLVTRFALPALHATRGCLLFAGSESGIMGLANNTVYSGTKGFLHAFAKGLAAEQARHGVRVNIVCPGPIDTAWTHSSSGPMTRQMEKMVVAGTPMGRRGTPEEVASVYTFLASDEASFMTGALVPVDGGITISKGNLGEEVPRDVRTPPAGTLDLKHQHDGLRNKHFERAS